MEDKECFCATLYTCYDLIRPDVVVELAWRNQLVDFAMPYMIQYFYHSYHKMKELDERTKVEEPVEEEGTESNKMMDSLGNHFMLANAAYNPQMAYMGNANGQGQPPMQPPQFFPQQQQQQQPPLQPHQQFPL